MGIRLKSNCVFIIQTVVFLDYLANFKFYRARFTGLALDIETTVGKLMNT